MELAIVRSPSVKGATIGALTVNGQFRCWSLEDEIREVPGQPVSAWKIKGQTAIPAGRYRVTMEDSNRFGSDTLTINGVDGFVAIRMHGGNTIEDTEGCPLLGMKATDHTIVGGTSMPAVSMLKNIVKPALDAGEEVWITIANPE